MPLKILFIADEKEPHDRVDAAVGKEHEVTHVQIGKVGMGLLKNRKFDLLITDYQMVPSVFELAVEAVRSGVKKAIITTSSTGETNEFWEKLKPYYEDIDVDRIEIVQVMTVEEIRSLINRLQL